MRHALIAAAVLAGASAFAQQVNYDRPASADARVYFFTPQPSTSEFMRIFGDGTNAVDPSGVWNANQSTWSYGYTKWDLSGFQAGTPYRVVSAKLTVWQQRNPNWNPNRADYRPLELRALTSSWKSAEEPPPVGFTFSDANNPTPGSVIATGNVSQYVATGTAFPITFDLGTALFEQYLNSALPGGQISFALASAMLPSDTTRTPFYSLSTINDPAVGVAPRLEIVAEPVPEPFSLAGLAAGAGLLALRRRRS